MRQMGGFIHGFKESDGSDLLKLISNGCDVILIIVCVSHVPPNP